MLICIFDDRLRIRPHVGAHIPLLDPSRTSSINATSIVHKILPTNQSNELDLLCPSSRQRPRIAIDNQKSNLPTITLRLTRLQDTVIAFVDSLLLAKHHGLVVADLKIAQIEDAERVLGGFDGVFGL